MRILGPNFTEGSKKDVFEKVTIQRALVSMGKKTESVKDVPAGNTVALMGVDNFLTKAGTITDHPNAFPIRNMKYSVSPVVRVAVQPKNPA